MHGHSKKGNGGKATPEYESWCKAKARCFNEKDRAYYRYGGRGITMCSRWRESFEAFLADMGRRPSPEHSIDRIDNDGDYEPGNCRWATSKQQRRNQRKERVRLNESDVPVIRAAYSSGESQASIATRYGVGRHVIYAAIQRKSYKDVE